MSGWESEVGGYANDSACQACGGPLSGLMTWCPDCRGIERDPQVKRTVLQTWESELRQARIRLRAYSSLLASAISRVDAYPQWSPALDAAAKSAHQDAIVAAHAAFMLNPNLRG